MPSTKKKTVKVKAWVVIFPPLKDFWLPTNPEVYRVGYLPRIYKTKKDALSVYPGCSNNEIIQVEITYKLPSNKKK